MLDDKQKKLKVLLVEDVAMFITIALELLKEHDVEIAKTAKEATELYNKYRPDITFLDISLPDGSGHDVLREIKNINKDAFVIMVTASRLEEDINKSAGNGAMGYITKPFSIDNIQESIDKYLGYNFSN